MMWLRYLVACFAAGVMVGRLFGVFARARFHYPLRIDEAPYWQQAVLNALQVVEWPGLFGLTLAAALVLWRWLGPRTTARARSSKPIAMLASTFGVVGAIRTSLTWAKSRSFITTFLESEKQRGHAVYDLEGGDITAIEKPRRKIPCLQTVSWPAGRDGTVPTTP